MSNLDKIKEILHDKKAALVVCYSNGEIKEYYQNRVKDIKEILKENNKALENAIVADKVIGKVAASLLTVAGVKEIYTDVISELAIPVLEDNQVKYEFEEKVEYIRNNDNTGMCPMENKYKDEQDIKKIYKEMLEK